MKLAIVQENKEDVKCPGVDRWIGFLFVKKDMRNIMGLYTYSSLQETKFDQTKTY